MRLGLFGLIGSGKTTALEYLKKYYSVKILDIDEISKMVMDEEIVKTFLMANFPTTINPKNKALNRSVLRTILFNDFQNNQRFAAFVWPLIEAKTKAILNDYPIDNNVIIEGALLPLLNLHLDKMVRIQTETPILTKRIKHRDGREAEETIKVADIQTQWLANYPADVIIHNDDTIKKFEEKLDNLMMTYQIPKKNK